MTSRPRGADATGPTDATGPAADPRPAGDPPLAGDPRPAGAQRRTADLALAAQAALDLVGSDPRSAVAAAHAMTVQARRARDAAALSTAQRALGLAQCELGELPAALRSLRAAVRTAQLADLPEGAAEARMSLAFALLDRGKVTAALTEADTAAATLTGLPAARLRSQRGLVLQRCGQLDAALQEYRLTLPDLQRAGDRLWQARLRNNRGLLRVDRGDLDLAEADFQQAGALYHALGKPLQEADCNWGLGDVAARRGDVRGALARYDETAACYAASGVAVPRLLLDRADVLLTAGLVDEAVRCADDAAEQFRRTLRATDLAEAHVLQAQCALAAGDHARARQAAAHAQTLLRQQRRPGWALVARYVDLRATAAAGDAVDVAGAARTADALEATGWRLLALDARIIAALAALAAGRLPLAQQQLTRAASARTGTVELRARAWYAEALLRQAAGRPRAAQSALRAGLRAVEEHRATLGATELRIRASSYGSALARQGLLEALRQADPGKALAWSERHRAGASRLRPIAPPRDGQLATLLPELRRVSLELESALLERRPAGSLRARRQALEQEVRAASRRTHAHASPAGLRPATAAQLRSVVRDRALVSYFGVDGSLCAVVLTARRTSLHRLGELAAPARALTTMHFGLRRLAARRGSPAAQRAAVGTVGSAAATLERLLVAPLLRAVGDRPLTIVPTALLHAVPWAVLPALRGRPLVVAPSATLWHRAAGRPAPGTTGPGLLVAGPRLTGAQAEVRALAARHPGAVRLSGAQARADAVLAALADADWAHLAAHGTFRSDNPFFSSIELRDGPLTVYDLERLDSVPSLVVLPSCQSGVGSVHPGEEVLSVAGALLALGARTILATVVPVPDDASARLMLAVHDQLSRRVEPDAALCTAAAELGVSDPDCLVAVAGFVCLGA